MPLDVADHFRGSVSIWASVTSVDGSRQTTFDDSTPVHKQLIDIKYSKDTRKQFKPGLPYKGKVRKENVAVDTVCNTTCCYIYRLTGVVHSYLHCGLLFVISSSAV